MLRKADTKDGLDVEIVRGHRTGAVGVLRATTPLTVEFFNGETWPYRTDELVRAFGDERQRFNWGFHDGADPKLSAELLMRGRKVVDHFDPAYAIGYVYGRTSRAHGLTVESSSAAWDAEARARAGDDGAAGRQARTRALLIMGEAQALLAAVAR